MHFVGERVVCFDVEVEKEDRSKFGFEGFGEDDSRECMIPCFLFFCGVLIENCTDGLMWI